jgi:DNA-directed RNA polymerase specialized sigma subunit
MADTIAKIVDLQEEIDRDIDMLIDLKRDILTAVNAVERLEYRLVLESRYLHFRTWQEIADTLGCNIRHIYRLHDAALKKIRVPPTCH